MENRAEGNDPTLGWPVDADVERRRLIQDAKSRGADPDEWLRLAAEISALHHPAPEEYRAVDRHLVSGFTIEESRRELLDHDVSQPPHSIQPDVTHSPDEGPVTF